MLGGQKCDAELFTFECVQSTNNKPILQDLPKETTPLDNLNLISSGFTRVNDNDIGIKCLSQNKSTLGSNVLTYSANTVYIGMVEIF